MGIRGHRAVLALAAATLIVAGCTTFRGAPKPLLTRKQVNGTELVDAKGQLDVLLAPSPSREARNVAQMNLMALADLRYTQYRDDLVNNRRGTRAGSGALTLFADIAATLTDSVGVKNNYIALSALVDGSEAVIDKEYLFDKTIDSLIARMDADRKAKEVEIYKRHVAPTEQYTGRAALADVLEYYTLGTLNSALVSVNKSVQAQAEEELAESADALKSIVSPQAVSNGEATERLSRFVESLNVAEMDRLRDFLRAKGIAVPQQSIESLKRNELRKGLAELRANYLGDGEDHDKAMQDTVNELRREKFTVPE